MSADQYTDNVGDVWEMQPDGRLRFVEYKDGSRVGYNMYCADLADLISTHGPISEAPPKADRSADIRTAALDKLRRQDGGVFPQRGELRVFGSCRDGSLSVDIVGQTGTYKVDVTVVAVTDHG